MAARTIRWMNQWINEWFCEKRPLFISASQGTCWNVLWLITRYEMFFDSFSYSCIPFLWLKIDRRWVHSPRLVQRSCGLDRTPYPTRPMFPQPPPITRDTLFCDIAHCIFHFLHGIQPVNIKLLGEEQMFSDVFTAMGFLGSSVTLVWGDVWSERYIKVSRYAVLIKGSICCSMSVFMHEPALPSAIQHRRR